MRSDKHASLIVVASIVWASTLYMVIWNENMARLSLSVPDSLTMLPSATEVAAATTTRRNIVESSVISFDTEKVDQFMERNSHSFGGQPVLWVPGVDGFHQPVLNQWAKLTGEEPLNASAFDRNNKAHKDSYRSPHAIGCYTAHWHLLRSLQHRPAELRPDLFFVFEDDASCVPDLINRTLEVTRQLPQDWDMFYIGGKPYSDFLEGLKMNFTDATKSTLRRDICRGGFGKATGPLAPDGSRSLSQDDPYWQIIYILNTHAYVVNPKRIERMLDVLKPRRTTPIDAYLAEAMERGALKAYMPTKNWCSGNLPPEKKMSEPTEWAGFFWFNMEKGAGMHPSVPQANLWQAKLMLDNCTY